ncbi:Nucleolar protein 9 [Podochytrium sp. JEL0797]|nr:Nucleolar protein 9 [Podochytrium sp. JEL0797]
MDTTPTTPAIAASGDKKKARRGKRGGQAANASAASTSAETGDDVVMFLDRVGDSAAPLVQAEAQAEEAAAPKDDKKRRRGKRAGVSKKEVKDVAAKEVIDNDEVYASIAVNEEDLEENTPEEETNTSNAPKPAPYNHLAASRATYRDSDVLLPHRDPSLPDQPELGRLDPDAQVYFVSIEKMLDDNDFETDEDRLLFVQNVYKEVGQNDIKLAADPDASRVLEKLIRLSSDVQVRRLMRSFQGMFSELFRHRFASHVAQTLMSLVADIVEREQMHGPAPEPVDEDDDNETDAKPNNEDGPLPSMESLFTSMCEELSNQWIHLMSDPWGSHLVRAILNVASGEILVSPKTTSLRSKKSQKYNAKTNLSGTTPVGPAAKTTDRKTAGGAAPKRRKIPVSFGTVLETVTGDMLANLGEYEVRGFAGNAVANPVLQILVAVKPAGQTLISQMVNFDADKGYAFFGGLITDTVGSHLVEKVLANASPKDFHAIYMHHFKDNLQSLCNHHVANFVVQHLIQNTRNGTQLDVLVNEILGNDGTGIEKLFFRNRQGVIVQLLSASVRHNSSQPALTTSFLSAFHTTTPTSLKQITPLVLYQQTLQDYTSHPSTKFDYFGAQMMEHLLHFAEPHSSLFINSFLSLSESETLTWVTSPLGSRVWEHVFKSPGLNLGAAKKLLHRLHPNYAKYACDRFGSYVVDAAWSKADLDAKQRIAEELALSRAQLEASFTGKFVWKNCRVEAFRKEGREVWVEKVQGVERKREMFKEFMEEEEEVVVDEGKGKEEEKVAKEEVGLWSTDKYDGEMAVLGFDAKKKGKKSGGGGMVLDEEEEEEVPKKRKRVVEAVESGEGQDDGMEDVLQALAATTKAGGKGEKKKKAKKV